MRHAFPALSRAAPVLADETVVLPVVMLRDFTRRRIVLLEPRTSGSNRPDTPLFSPATCP